MFGTPVLAENPTEIITDSIDPHFMREAGHRIGTVCVVGLGYVGLPVAVAFGKERLTIGYDLSAKKIHNLKQHNDPTGEVAAEELRRAQMLTVTDDPELIRQADYIIVAVPTPVNDAHQPDFSPLEGASRTVGRRPESAQRRTVSALTPSSSAASPMR